MNINIDMQIRANIFKMYTVQVHLNKYIYFSNSAQIVKLVY